MDKTRILIVAGLWAAVLFGLACLIRFGGGLLGIPEAQRLPLGTVALAAAVLGGGIETAWQLAERRRERLNRAAAEANGFAYDVDVPPGVDRPRPVASLFEHGGIEIRHWMRGVHDGRNVHVFDLQYSEVSMATEGGPSTVHYRQTVFCFPDAARGLPSFRLCPRDRFTRFMARLFRRRLDRSPAADTPESAAEAFTQFEWQYALVPVTSIRSGRPLRDLFPDQAVRWLVARPGWSIESDGCHLVLWISARRFAGSNRFAMLDQICELVGLITSRAADTVSTSPPP